MFPFRDSSHSCTSRVTAVILLFATHSAILAPSSIGNGRRQRCIRLFLSIVCHWAVFSVASALLFVPHDAKRCSRITPTILENPRERILQVGSNLHVQRKASSSHLLISVPRTGAGGPLTHAEYSQGTTDLGLPRVGGFVLLSVVNKKLLSRTGLTMTACRFISRYEQAGYSTLTINFGWLVAQT